MDKKISQLTAATTPLTGAEELAIVQSGVTKKTTIEDVKGYKVYTALLTQSGGDGPMSNNSDSPQPLIIGVTYYIDSNSGNADFTNVGAPNNNSGTYFVATGTIPNSWGDGNFVELIYNTGAPVVTVLENTTGLNLFYIYVSAGKYVIQIGEGASILDKSVIVFVNGGNTNNIIPSPNFLVKANYSYEENVFYITSFESGIFSNDMLSDSDKFYRTSLEIRVYN